MTQLKIHKKDELYLFLESIDKGLLYEIYEHFSYYVEGYKHMPKYKNGQWDGKIRLLNLKTKTFPFGLIIDLIKFCDKNEYTYEIVNQTDLKLVNLKDDFTEFKNNITNITKMSILDKYQFQIDAVEKLIKYNKALLKSPTASGKSNIIYMLVRFFLDVEENDILICVPSISLVEQLFGDFISYVNDDFNVDDNCHRIYGGKDRNTKKRIVISTWQSIFRLQEDWFAKFGVFICDEAHQADSNSLTKIINNIPKIKYRYGLTGTLDGSKIHELQMRALFGPIIELTTTKKLMDSQVLSHLNIDCIILQYSNEEIKHVAKYCKTYQDEITWLVNNDRRNKYILSLALTQKNNTLVLFNFIEGHGQGLYDYALTKAEEYNKQIFFIHGGISVEIRENIREIAEQNDNVIIFASYGTFSQGVNVKNLHTIIFAHPFKSKIRNLQSIGRTLRRHDSKTTAKLIDIGDDLTINGNKNIIYRHLIERLKIYDDEQFEYTIKRKAI